MLICSVFHLSVQNSKSLLFFFKFLELKYIQERKGNIHFLKKTPTKCHVMCTWSLLLFSCQVMSDSLQHHGLQHDRLPRPSLSPGVCSDSCPLSWWCYLTISLSVALFSFCFQIFPASESFPVSQLFTSGGQSYGSFSISLSNEYSGLILFRIYWFDLLAVQGTLKSLL